jgi:hypothetical protein
MARKMPRLEKRLAADIDKAVDFAKACERMRILNAASGASYQSVHRTKIEDIYELAYLRLFVSWEDFLEASFIRYLCGHCTRRYASARLHGGLTYAATLAHAERVMLNGQDYVLWGSTKRALQCVRRTCARSRHEIVIGGTVGELQNYCAIRNRVAHGQPDCIRKFNAAVGALSKGGSYGRRAGNFLRGWDNSVSPPVRWIETIASRLKGIGNAIV